MSTHTEADGNSTHNMEDNMSICGATTKKGTPCKNKNCYIASHKEEVNMDKWNVERDQDVQDVFTTTRMSNMEAYNRTEKAWKNVTPSDIINMVHDNFNLYGRPISVEAPTNINREDDNIELYVRRAITFKKLLPMQWLTKFGIVHSVGELNVPSMDLARIFADEDWAQYIEEVEERHSFAMTNEVLASLASIYMLGQVGLNSISTKDNNLVIGKEAISRFEKPSIKTGFFEWNLIDVDGKETRLVSPFTFSVNDKIKKDDVYTMTAILGGTLHDARSSIGSTKYGASLRGTNDGFCMDQVLPKNKSKFVTSSLGKSLAKRNFTLAGRSFTKLVYDANITETQWNFGNEITVNVAIIDTPYEAGDGMAAFSTPAAFGKFMAALGENEKEMTKWAERNHTFSLNMLTNLFFDKGHWHMCHGTWPFSEDIDIVVDRAALDTKTLLVDSVSNRVAISLSPMKVKEDETWLELNARQLTVQAMKWFDHQIIDEFPQWFLDDVRQALKDAIWDTIISIEDDYDDEEEQENNFTGDKIRISKLEDKGENQVKEELKDKKRDFYRAVSRTGIWGHPVTIHRFVRRWYQKIDKMVKDYSTNGFCGLLFPSKRLRTTTPPYISGNNALPKENSVSPVYREGAKNPWSVAIDPALLKSMPFQFRMEFVDHDDGVIVMWTTDANGQDYIVLIKEPTSPDAGAMVPVEREVAEKFNLRNLPTNPHVRHRTDEEIANELNNTKRLYKATPLREKIEATTPINYAFKVAEIVDRLGSMPLLANLMALASRSRLWEDRTFAEWSYNMFVQMSEAVDAQVSKDVSIKRMVDAFTKAILDEMIAGKPIDTTYLNTPESEFLMSHLVRSFTKLVDGPDTKYTLALLNEYITNDKLTPNNDGPWLEQYALVASVPQAVKSPMQYNSAVLAALTNGPVHNYLSTKDMSKEVYEVAVTAYLQIRDVYRKSLDWKEQEREMEAIANNAINTIIKIEDYKAGAFTRTLLQLHATHDSGRQYQFSIHTDVPGNLDLPVIEYLPAWELDAAYDRTSEPAFFVQIKNADALTPNNVYKFSVIAGTLYIMDAETELLGDEDDDMFATSVTVPAQKWGKVFNDHGVRFLGLVPASRKQNRDGSRPDPVAVFTPSVDSDLDVLESLNWTPAQS